jgi:microcystin-dependent protein
MKKIYTLIISILLILNQANAQVPQGFKYQTAIRDNNGTVLANKLVAIKLSLLMGTANGTTVYSELHKVATNDFGVANLNVGGGTILNGNFTTIDWGSNSFFLKTEVDVNNGTNFVFMGTSQLLSVPFAMYAAKSANAANDKDQDSTNEIQNISLNNNALQLSKNGGNIDLTKYDKDSQQLVLNGNTLSITKGNSVVLSGAVDLDADPTNEIQNLSLVNDTVKLSKANFVVLPKDNDADSTNEIQSLSINQNKLIISKSNQVNIDSDTTNEIQTLSITNDTLKLSKANNIILPKDNDRDSLNELQMLSISNDTLKLSKANSVFLPTMPVGSIIAYGGRNTPNGWLLCDGSTVSRITYSRLFASIDSVWGNGNGTTTFHLPDLRGQFLRGVSGTSTNDPDANLRTNKNLNGNAGNKVGSFQNDELKSHNHTVGVTINIGSTSAYSGDGSSVGSFPTSSTGGSETRPKNAYVYFIIKF